MNSAKNLKQTNVEDLIPYAANARTHSDDQVNQIAASIKEFGFNNPILVDESMGVIAGHGRLEAAKRLELKEVPTLTLGHLTDAERRAYILADNRLAMNAGWDDEMLSAELSRLEGEIDLSLLGFEDDELTRLLDQMTLDEVDEAEDLVPEPPEEPITKIGEIWELGNHRLAVGDATDEDVVQKLMDGRLADLVFTDPPYGMDYAGGRGTKKVKQWEAIINDDLKGNDLIDMLYSSISNAKLVSKIGASFYVCLTWRTFALFEASLNKVGLDTTSCIVWDKKSIGLGNSNYRPQHEFIFYAQGDWYGDKSQSDVWHLSRGSNKYLHPTQKPIELIERALTNSSKREDIVFDCFGGSGSTLIACEKLNRHARLMELEPVYADVIITRWQDYTGETARCI